MAYNYYKQLRTVLTIEILIVSTVFFSVTFFWGSLCETTVISCLKDKNISFFSFLLLSLLRPFFFTPVPVFALIAGNTYGPIIGTLFTATSATFSSAIVYLIGKTIGKRLVSPWLSTNLPQTLRFLRSQDWKIILAFRLIPFVPFDLSTLIFGLLNFRWKHLILFTFIGTIPEALIFTKIANPSATFFSSTMVIMSVLSCSLLIPGIIIEYMSRKKGNGMWLRLKAMWTELYTEIKLNNSIIKRRTYDPNKTPVLLLYGFFSSRRSLTVLERILSFRGYEVFSFNLGGVFEVFFTKGIIETAQFIDFKLKRQFDRHNFDKINIIAHSKGGLVAMWWLLKLGGHKHCNNLITMGTPYKGTRLTWLGLLTPIGLIFKDLWQMRPGSSLLKELHNQPIPKGCQIYNLYSNKDKVATGSMGIFETNETVDNIHHIPMHHISHFEFLYRRDVGDTLARLLGSPHKSDNFKKSG